MYLSLNPREHQTLTLLSFGYSTPDIANALFLSSETVKTYRRRLLNKMDARNTAGLIRRGFEYGILKIDDKNQNCTNH